MILTKDVNSYRIVVRKGCFGKGGKMFNINGLLKKFNQFVYDYEKEESKENINALELKRKHTIRVWKAAKFIVQKEDVSLEQKELAEVIAILHDVGRFEQFKAIGRYIDAKNFNHAEVGADMLQEGLIEYFVPETRKFDAIIIKAVRLHNVLNLPDDLEGMEAFQCELIRDADRLDIFYSCTREEQFDIVFARKRDTTIKSLNPEIISMLMKRKPVDVRLVRNSIDLLALRIALLNQFKFKEGLAYIRQEGYIDKMFELFQKKTEGFSQKELDWLKQYASNILNS